MIEAAGMIEFLIELLLEVLFEDVEPNKFLIKASEVIDGIGEIIFLIFIIYLIIEYIKDKRS